MDKNRFDKLMSVKDKPIPHTTEDNACLLSSPKVRTAYDALEDEYAELDALLKTRMKAGITQVGVAILMH